jgi:hypothetical protein
VDRRQEEEVEGEHARHGDGDGEGEPEEDGDDEDGGQVQNPEAEDGDVVAEAEDRRRDDPDCGDAEAGSVDRPLRESHLLERG